MRGQPISKILNKIKTATKRPCLIGIDGQSGAGKSTLAHTLQARLSDTVVIHKDDFYREMDEWIRRWAAAEAFYITNFRQKKSTYIIFSGE